MMWPFSADTGVLPGAGRFHVGCVDVMSDGSQLGCFMRLFYPADTPDTRNDKATYPTWLPSREYAAGFVEYTGWKPDSVSSRLLTSFLNSNTGSVKVPAVWNTPLAKSDTPFPILVFSHGLAGCRTTYSSICVEMASQGFVVGAVEHRDRSACATYILKQNAEDGGDCTAPSSDREKEWVSILLVEGDDFEIRNNQLNTRAAECTRTLDLLFRLNSGDPVTNLVDEQFDNSMLKGKLDTTNVGVCGHSFGAAATLLTLAKDKRFKCGVALDAWAFPIDKSTYANIEQPVLLINTEKFHWPSNVAPLIRLVPDFNNPTEDRKMITIMGTVHLSQTDFALLFRPRIAKLLHFAGPLNPKLAMQLNNQATLAFFSAHFGLQYNTDFDKLLKGEHEHVVIGTNVELDSEKVQNIRASL